MRPKFLWPWGRLSPDRRMEEIDKMIRTHHSSMRIIQHQAQESLRLHKKSIESLLNQKKVVMEFSDEGKRKQIMETAYLLESEGHHVLEKISEAESLEEIESILNQSALSGPQEFLEIEDNFSKVPISEKEENSIFKTDIEHDDLFFNPKGNIL